MRERALDSPNNQDQYKKQWTYTGAEISSLCKLNAIINALSHSFKLLCREHIRLHIDWLADEEWTMVTIQSAPYTLFDVAKRKYTLHARTCQYMIWSLIWCSIE